MGKQIGTYNFTGKLGSVVGMKGKSGNAYVRTLVTPANPKTAAQTDQRVKMSLAGQMSKLVPQALLVGMSNNKRMRRPNFTGNIARNAVVTTVNDQRAAKIDPALVLFSDGIAESFDENNLTVTPQDNKVNITALRDIFDETNVVSVIVVAAFADANGSVVNIASVTITSASLTSAIMAPAGYSRVNVYYIPVVMAEGSDNVSYQHVISMLAQDASYQTLATISATGSIEYRRSVYLSTLTPGA